MGWTEDTPTVSGNYWYIAPGDEGADMVWVEIEEEDSWVEFGYEATKRLYDVDGLWYGPVGPPELPSRR